MLLAHAAVTALTAVVWHLCGRAAVVVVTVLRLAPAVVIRRRAPSPVTRAPHVLTHLVLLVAAPRRGPPTAALRLSLRPEAVAARRPPPVHPPGRGTTMPTRRTLARLAALPAATALVALVAAPAGAHVTGTPSVANAGSYTVLTMSVPHGCDGSPTTEVEIQVPESVLSVTPTRNPLYDLDVNIQQLDEPLTDAHGNEVTERVGSIVYTARTPLPEGQRDTFELSFQVPDVAGETLAFPTIQTCEQGRTDWIEVPEDGSGRRGAGAPGAVVRGAARRRGGRRPRRGRRDGRPTTPRPRASPTTTPARSAGPASAWARWACSPAAPPW